MTRYAIVLCVLLGLLAENESKRVCKRPWKTYGGNCYLFSTVPASWFEAQSACRLVHSKLAEPISGSLGNYLNWGVKSYYRGKSFWIGGTDMEHQRHWKWVTSGVDIRGSNLWQPGEPNNYKGKNERCVETFGRWNDLPCSHRRYFICQKY